MADYTCLRCFKPTTTEKVADLACVTCAGRGHEPIWRTVTIADTKIDDVPGGRVHTLYVDDAHKAFETADDVEEILTKDADDHPVIIDAAIGAALAAGPEGEEDPAKRILATLDALVADDSAEALEWKDRRMAAPAK